MMRRRLSGARLGLQLVVAVGALVPVSAGLAGVLTGMEILGHADIDAGTDSQFRFLSGLLLAIGVGFWSCIPRIEFRAGRFRLLTMLIFVGGLARLFAASQAAGTPPLAALGALVMELVVTPLLCLWQASIAERRGGIG